MSKNTKISYSAVNQFKQCPSKYYLSRQYKMTLQASAFAFGSAVEDGVSILLEGGTVEEAKLKFEESWRVRPESRFEPATPVFDSEDIFYYNSDYDKGLLTDEDLKLVDEWYSEVAKPEIAPLEHADSVQATIKAGKNPTPEDRKYYHRVVWQSCLRRGQYMMEAFKDQVLPEVTKVHAVQKEIEITNEDGDKAMGFIDFVLEIKGMKGPVIFDLKTAGRMYEEHDLQTTDQLRIYAAAEGIKNIGYIVLLKGIKKHKFCNKCGAQKHPSSRKVKCESCGEGRYTVIKPEGATQIMCREITDKEVHDVLHDFSDVLTAIKNDVRWKNQGNCFAYGTRCEFYENCWGGKKLEDMDHLKKRERK